MMAKEVFIYDAIRVPTGKKGGYYKNVLPENLSSFLIDKLLLRNPEIGNKLSEILLGNAIGGMGNMSRFASLKSSLPNNVLASTLDIQCGGTYQAMRLARALILSEESSAILAGGLESNSLMPTRIYNSKDPRYKGKSHVGQAEFSPYAQLTLIKSAEKLARKYRISKTDMINWVLASHAKSDLFSQSELYARHIAGFGSFPCIDQTIRTNLTFDKLNALAESSLIDRTNTADFHDGAGIILLGSENASGTKPLAKIVDINITGIDPDNSPDGCIVAAEDILLKNGIDSSEIDLFEINESFACKPLAFSKHFEVEEGNINILGGNLSMGHPYAASGVINMINLISGLKLKNKKYGLVSAGVAGGFGAAVLIENIK
jgi:acetyl-CoA C-acetyltransferase